MTELTRPAPRTIQDVAVLAGVSVATVSRVLNGRDDVAAATREAVLSVVREHNFSKRSHGASRRPTLSGLIGVTVPEIQAGFFAGVVAGAAEALEELDRRLVLCPTHDDYLRERRLVDRLVDGITDGALLIVPRESTEDLRGLHRRSYPFVVVEPPRPIGAGIACVTATHTAGATAAVDHLLELGHRRIGAIMGPESSRTTEERLAGLRAAFATAGVAHDPELLVRADWGVQQGHAAAAQLLDKPQPPTAIFGFNDDLAIGAMIAARERGLRIPEDISVVGFDDVPAARVAVPPLTTVRQPLAEMGRLAISLLERQIHKRPLDAMRVDLRTTLVVRDSTAPPNPRRDR